ncbi:RNA-guided endonuclease InsQ/TnpB family protein [Actinokineospora xionganensis]|uniref:RNA-guided endonuclease InsQ/TnpB family protein n=1 Tax=Actinokineospora xionganensis TaxID=2684470 RepID=UPI00406BCAE4
MPEPISAPGTGAVVGVDRGVAVSAALSTGELLSVPTLRASEKVRLLRLQRKLARAQRGSNRRGKVKTAIARLGARDTDRRKDWVEKTSTCLAREFDVIAVEDLKIRTMTQSARGTLEAPGRGVCLAREFDVIAVEDLKIRTMTQSARGTLEAPGRGVRQKAGLNRGILANGWGLLVTRLEQKAPGRVVKVDPRFTSQRCSACGVVDREARESQAVFRCRSCGFACNADVNAALNIRLAAGHAVTARGGLPLGEPANREPQRDFLLVR